MQGPASEAGRGRHGGLTAPLVFVVIAILIPPIFCEAQTALTPTQAEAKAETLLGRKPDHVDSYFSREENSQYFAFTLVPESKWDEATNTAAPAQEEIWFYEKPEGMNEMRKLGQEDVLFWPEAQRSMAKGIANNGKPSERSQLWPKYLKQFIRYDLPSGFVTLPGRTFPCLRLSAQFGNPAILPGATTRLGLYCLDNRRLSWLDFEPDFGSLAQTGVVGRVKVNDDHAPEDSTRMYLHSWGRELGLNVPAFDATSDAPRRLQQRWIDANGRKACSYEQTPPFRWKTWKTEQIDKLTPYATRRLLSDPKVVLSDGRFQWLSYPGPDAHADEGSALAGIGRYDTQLQRYDLIYVPDSSYDYSKELVVIGNWLYIQDCGERWAVRFNKISHRLERGDFDNLVGKLSTGVYHTSDSDQGLGERASRHIGISEAPRIDSTTSPPPTERGWTIMDSIFAKCEREHGHDTRKVAECVARYQGNPFAICSDVENNPVAYYSCLGVPLDHKPATLRQVFDSIHHAQNGELSSAFIQLDNAHMRFTDATVLGVKKHPYEQGGWELQLGVKDRPGFVVRAIFPYRKDYGLLSNAHGGDSLSAECVSAVEIAPWHPRRVMQESGGGVIVNLACQAVSLVPSGRSSDSKHSSPSSAPRHQ